MTKESLADAVRVDLETRIQHLEEQARVTLDILEMAATLGDFQTSINKLHEPSEILRETTERVRQFIPFLGMAFYLVEEDTSDFVLSLCDPPRYWQLISEEISRLIDAGIFSMALRENRPITVYSQDKKYRLILHALATSSRTRGMFVGVRGRDERNVSAIMLSLMTIVLKHCANAIESFELYRLFREKASNA